MTARALTMKHEQAALLVAQGELTNAQVAERVGLSEQRFYKVKARRDFQALVERYRERMLAGTADQIKKELMADAPRNLRFLKETRDGDFKDDEKVMGSRLKASQMLFDRQVPKRDEAEVGGVTIVINADVAERIKKASAEEVEWDDDTQ